MALASQPSMPLTTLTTEAVIANIFIGFDGKKCGANLKAMGVTHLAYDDATYATIYGAGVVEILAAGTIAVGDPVVSDASGKAVAASTFAVTTATTTTTEATITGTATPAAGATPMTSTGAQPAIPVTATAEAASTSESANTLAGSILPQAINGYAVTAGTSGAKMLIKLI